MNKAILDILNGDSLSQQKALFAFDSKTEKELIRKKFTIWARWFFPKFFQSKDAPFHKQIDLGNIETYLSGGSFLNIAFRGSAKTTRTKLFIAFAIANDESHFRKYFKILSKDIGNAKQSCTDIYNMLISKRVKTLYPEIFGKSDAKREETMASFTSTTGVKVKADTIGTDQRGDLQDESRPDFLWFDDFETALSLMSAVTTFKIWQNMDEALQGTAKGGGAIYTCNYLSERGNVHKLVQKVKNQIIMPIEIAGVPTWDRYSPNDLMEIKSNADNWEGDYLCQPSASKDIYFDRTMLDRMMPESPKKTIGGFKIFREYNPAHRYGGGHDVAGGVGLDSSASVFIDFDVLPAKVVATYHSNEILPEAFGDAIYQQGNFYGGCIVAPENNKYDQAILRAKQLGANLYKTQGKVTRIGYAPPTTYGWSTNSLTKNQMLASLAKAIGDGLLDLTDPDLINEVRAYTRNDLIDTEPDVRLTTRHFDLVIALAIAWQMKDWAVAKPPDVSYNPIWAKAETNPGI